MGHAGMLYSLPSRELIADCVEYMVNAHCADALVCISNCDKITPGMLMAAMRLNIPVVFVSGGPMEAGKIQVAGKVQRSDLISAMVAAANPDVSDEEAEVQERSACPTCGSCSGMFTANSMNCLTEALGLALPGNGSTLATHAERRKLFVEAGWLIVDLARRWYEQDDALRAAARHRERSRRSRMRCRSTSRWAARPTRCCICSPRRRKARCRSPWRISTGCRAACRNLCKVAPSVPDVHMEDVHRAGGIMAHSR